MCKANISGKINALKYLGGNNHGSRTASLFTKHNVNHQNPKTGSLPPCCASGNEVIDRKQLYYTRTSVFV